MQSKQDLPTELDLEEPERVADAAVQMGLRHCVVTSVARDDLADGGAMIFAETIKAIRAQIANVHSRSADPRFLGPGRVTGHGSRG